MNLTVFPDLLFFNYKARIATLLLALARLPCKLFDEYVKMFVLELMPFFFFEYELLDSLEACGHDAFCRTD